MASLRLFPPAAQNREADVPGTIGDAAHVEPSSSGTRLACFPSLFVLFRAMYNKEYCRSLDICVASLSHLQMFWVRHAVVVPTSANPLKIRRVLRTGTVLGCAAVMSYSPGLFEDTLVLRLKFAYAIADLPVLSSSLGTAGSAALIATLSTWVAECDKKKKDMIGTAKYFYGYHENDGMYGLFRLSARCQRQVCALHFLCLAPPPHRRGLRWPTR